MLNKAYSYCFAPEPDGTFAAYVREFPGCYSQGDSIQEAYDNLREAAANWVEAARSMGQDIPEPLEIFHSQP